MEINDTEKIVEVTMKNLSKNVMKKMLETQDLSKYFRPDHYDQLSLIEYDKNEVVVLEGQKFNFVGIILLGEIDIHPSSDSGREMFLTRLKKHDFIGEVEFFNEKPYYHTGITISKTRILVISKQLMQNELMQSLEFCQFLCYRFANKLIDHSSKFSSNKLYSGQYRFVKYLLERVRKKGDKIDNFKGVTVAKQIGISERHLKRIIFDLVEEKIIVKRAHEIEIVDYEALIHLLNTIY